MESVRITKFCNQLFILFVGRNLSHSICLLCSGMACLALPPTLVVYGSAFPIDFHSPGRCTCDVRCVRAVLANFFFIPGSSRSRSLGSFARTRRINGRVLGKQSTPNNNNNNNTRTTMADDADNHTTINDAQRTANAPDVCLPV